MKIEELERFKRLFETDIKEFDRLLKRQDRQTFDLQCRKLETLLALRDLERMIEKERGKKQNEQR